MSYRLSNREIKALENAKFENDYLQGDFCPKAKLGAGIGKTTIESLVSLGLIEVGYSEYHREANCVRITADGERCLYGGLTMKEVMERAVEGKKYYPPRLKHWPVIEEGVFR